MEGFSLSTPATFWRPGAISFMYMFKKFEALMNSATQRSMSFSHETSAATVAEAHCYGAAIGQSLLQILDRAKPIDTTGASTDCTGFADTCHAISPAPGPAPHWVLKPAPSGG